MVRSTASASTRSPRVRSSRARPRPSPSRARSRSSRSPSTIASPMPPWQRTSPPTMSAPLPHSWSRACRTRSRASRCTSTTACTAWAWCRPSRSTRSLASSRAARAGRQALWRDGSVGVRKMRSEQASVGGGEDRYLVRARMREGVDRATPPCGVMRCPRRHGSRAARACTGRGVALVVQYERAAGDLSMYGLAGGRRSGLARSLSGVKGKRCIVWCGISSELYRVITPARFIVGLRNRARSVCTHASA